MKIVSTFLNPANWVKAWLYAKRSSKFDKSQFDLELYLYSRILTNDMLHYGYFEDTSIAPETISIKQIEDAQVKYAMNIVENISDTKNRVLDVGCGMGGLGKIISDRGITVECLTPNKNQIEHINAKYPGIKTHTCKFEDFSSSTKYGTVINSESLQYISLDDAFNKVGSALLPGGRWIIVDYFRISDTGINKSSHFLADFRNKASEYKWKIVSETDITLNVLPTIAYVNMYFERFLLPLKHFGYEKLRYKKPWLYFLTEEFRNKIDHKFLKEKASIDPLKFLAEKKYILYVLEKE